jgi:hypothetical protein
MTANEPDKIYLHNMPNPKIRCGIYRDKITKIIVLGLLTDQVLQLEKEGKIEIIQRS